jgi:hypothetical protein
VPGVREQWLRLASQWERLAKEAEKQRGQFAERPGVVPAMTMPRKLAGLKAFSGFNPNYLHLADINAVKQSSL